MISHFLKICVVISLTLIDSVNAQKFEYLKSFNLYNVQMHIHGHSHHNASDKPGSIQWHTHQAKENNVDILWWTEHDGMLNQKKDFTIDFSEGEFFLGRLGRIRFLLTITATPHAN